MERSAIFSCLLADETFGRLTTEEGSRVVTEVHEAWRASDSTDMFTFVQQWLAEHPLRKGEGR